jgi:predicted RNase H-like HicB family nuclease
VAELPGCHAKARSIDAVMTKILDAVDIYLDVENQENEPLYEFVDIKVIDVPKREIDLAACR